MTTRPPKIEPGPAAEGSPSFPAVPGHVQPHSSRAIDQTLAELVAQKRAWAELPTSDLINLLKSVSRAYAAVADRWVAACAEAKAVGPGTFAEGEEWIVFAMGLRAINYLISSLEDINRIGAPRIPGGLQTTEQGRTVARVFPAHWTDRLLYRGITADVWMPEGVSPEAVRGQQAWAYQSPSDGQIAVVLAAGNLSILPLLDTLDRLFVKRQVVLLKTNPVNDYLDPILAQALQPLIEAGCLRLIRGGAEQGEYLTRHPMIDSIHVTGSDKTFRRIVFGPESAAEPAAELIEPVMDKEISAELGNVTPLIVVPGPWTQRDLRHKAAQLASWMAVNAAFNCLSPRIVIQQAEWSLRGAFLAAVEDVLAEIPTRKAYYPGAKQRQQHFVEHYDDVRQIGHPRSDELPWTLIRGVDASGQDELALRSEVFCSVLSETALHAQSTVDFIRKAVDFADRAVWGTLIVSLFVHPRSMADPEIRAAIDRAIADLDYGTVCLNLRGEYGYYPLLSPWGGAPGSSLNDPQSGRGVINNPLMFKHSWKSVVRGPFRQWPDPFLATSNRLVAFSKALIDFERSRSLTRLPKVLWSALT